MGEPTDTRVSLLLLLDVLHLQPKKATSNGVAMQGAASGSCDVTESLFFQGQVLGVLVRVRACAQEAVQYANHVSMGGTATYESHGITVP